MSNIYTSIYTTDQSGNIVKTPRNFDTKNAKTRFMKCFKCRKSYTDYEQDPIYNCPTCGKKMMIVK